MAIRSKEGGLKPDEKRIVKALLAEGMRNRDIQALVNTGRGATINSARIKSASIATVGTKICLRSLKMDRRTVRRHVTRGEIEHRTSDHPLQGYSFVSCNWTTRKAKFVAPSGKLHFVAF